MSIIWERDGCETENGRRMKEIMNEQGLPILNCVWDGLSEVTWYTLENKLTVEYVCMDGGGMKKVVSGSTTTSQTDQRRPHDYTHNTGTQTKQ